MNFIAFLSVSARASLNSIEVVGGDACGGIDSVEFGREADSAAALQSSGALSPIKPSYSVQIATPVYCGSRSTRLWVPRGIALG